MTTQVQFEGLPKDRLKAPLKLYDLYGQRHMGKYKQKQRHEEHRYFEAHGMKALQVEQTAVGTLDRPPRGVMKYDIAG